MSHNHLQNSESRGFAFVRFYSKRDAGDAIDAFDGRDLDGRFEISDDVK